ncbi:hypothetical protein H8F22_12625 [Pseudomonas sp. P154a]|uniref:hypothetical protein n=1 Tax=Pseudomonas mucoides TaxID=2730424 RepID=UPI0018928682|nr:hypothetical protein [Pseudomonas mucoides]MBF6039718.1 hypothetical protein [Pseudomonas mucoides]
MDKIILFLADENNRLILNWIGGALATLAGGLWVVIRYLLERSEKKRTLFAQKKETEEKAHAPPSITDEPAVQPNSIYVKDGIAIGSGANVSARDIIVGYRLRGLAFTLFAIGLLLILAGYFFEEFASSVIATKLTKYELTLSCGNTGKTKFDMSPDELTDVIKFRDFLSENENKTFFLHFEIQKACSACKCPRVAPSPPEPGPKGFLVIDDPQKEHWTLSPMMKEAHEIIAFHTHLVVDTIFYLPTYEQLPENGLFQKGGYGFYAYYDGPFTAKYFEGTGYTGGYIEPVVIASSEIINQVKCIREEKSLNFFQKLYHQCF